MYGYCNKEVKRWVVTAVAIVPLCFHDLRHSAAIILISMGVNSRVVQEPLGHSTISITLGVYGHVTLIDATRGHAEMR